MLQNKIQNYMQSNIYFWLHFVLQFGLSHACVVIDVSKQ